MSSSMDRSKREKQLKKAQEKRAKENAKNRKKTKSLYLGLNFFSVNFWYFSR